MATANFVVVRRTISQTLVPYKEVEEKLLKRLGTKSKLSQRLSSSSTNTVVQCGVTQWKDPKRVTFDDEKLNILERSRSEVCLRRKSSYARETSLDAYEEKPGQEELVKPILRRRERDVASSPRRSNTRPLARPQSDFFPEFQVKLSKNEVGATESENEPEKRLGRSIATLRREMISLRKQDRELLKQLTSLNEHISDLKELSRIQGGLFGSCEDDEDIGESINTGRPNVQRANSTTITGKNSPRKVIDITREKPTENSKNRKNDGNKIKGGVRKLQETAFEYNGEPLGNPAGQQQARVVKNVKPLRPMSVVVPKKKSLRLERKSMSCQFLDSGGTREKKDLSAENLKTVDTRQCTRMSWEALGGSRIPSDIIGRTRILEKHVSDLRNLDINQKSLSMSQLKRATKTTEVSTSDSECSTSGCYGGSSTGSELELERNVAEGNTSSDEEHEKSKKPEKGKAFELELLKAGTKPQRYHAISTKQPGQFRKKIVSV